ncbi:MAG: phenylpyruvate tautomerase MIF-related protein [bacterium]|nr:phenylpyruvate tautomerase MIF-related protein [bacterium]
MERRTDMPYVEVITNAKLNTAAEVAIKAGLGRLLYEIAGKDEQWLMVRIVSEEELFFKGSSDTHNAFVEIRYVGSFTSSVKQKLTQAIGQLLQETAKIQPDKLYVHFVGGSGSDWGWKGELLG